MEKKNVWDFLVHVVVRGRETMWKFIGFWIIINLISRSVIRLNMFNHCQTELISQDQVETEIYRFFLFFSISFHMQDPWKCRPLPKASVRYVIFQRAIRLWRSSEFTTVNRKHRWRVTLAYQNRHSEDGAKMKTNCAACHANRWRMPTNCKVPTCQRCQISSTGQMQNEWNSTHHRFSAMAKWSLTISFISRTVDDRHLVVWTCRAAIKECLWITVTWIWVDSNRQTLVHSQRQLPNWTSHYKSQLKATALISTNKMTHQSLICQWQQYHRSRVFHICQACLDLVRVHSRSVSTTLHPISIYLLN